jgi:hypothetical protein
VWVDVERPPRDAPEYNQSARRCVVAACGSVRQSDRLCQGLEVVEGFRTALYGCATRRADAWFELCDALLVTERLVSLPHLLAVST